MRLSLQRIIWVVCLLSALSFGIPLTAHSADTPVYDDGLATGWDSWSWNTTVNFSAASPVRSGTKSLSVTYTAAWAGLYLHADPAIDLTGYDHLTFWVHGGNSGNQQFCVVANNDGNNTFSITAPPNVWVKVDVPLSTLGTPSILSDLYWQDTTGGPQPTFYLDDITLVARSGPPPPPITGPSLSIDAAAGRHPISEDIYGMNFVDEQLAAELRLPVRRWGGNSTTRYNWQNDTHNTGSDWYFENIPEDNPNPDLLPNGSAADRFVEQDRRTGTKTIMTMPLMGWTPKRRLSDHPYDCGFKVSKYGAQQSVDPWDTDCGNGLHSDGSAVTGNEPADTSIQIGPDFVAAWINHLTARYGTAAVGGVAYYNLDNEPMLWNSTHRDVHPQPVTYDELRDRTFQYAAAIKAADPSAKTLGPVLWGWCAYFYSALDGCGIGSDYQSHGNTPFVVWYLQQMKAYEQQHGVRILDYLDLHHYPQANGVSLSPAGNSATQALRLRSTRSLWDPTYIDESWISDTAPGGVAVQMILRMKEWVDANYPGTKLAITEYNWGALDHINGALAQADILGIFGREGLDLVTLWKPPSANQPGAFAFRVYRNYDTAGGQFGDVGVQAASADQGMLSVYAAQRSTDNALTVVVINKTANALTSNVTLAGFNPAAPASVYRYSSANAAAIERLADQAVSASGFSATFAAASITLFVVISGDTNLQTLTVNKAGSGSGDVTPSTGTIAWNGSVGTVSYSYNMQVILTAMAASGSSFTGWTGCNSVSGNQCMVTMDGAKSVTATFTAESPFINPSKGTLGTVITISGSGYGTVKGKVLIGNVAPKILEWNDSSVRCQLLKSPSPGIYDVTIQPKGASPIVLSGSFTVESPEIDSVDPTSGSAGDTVIVSGAFFGTKKGKVTLEGKTCKVVSWTMAPTTGESEIRFVVPKGLSLGTHELKVTNGVGEDTTNFIVD